MTRALESTWPRNAPCRAQVGSEWCMLCQDSPLERTLSHQTLPAWSLVRNGLLPATWQIELMDQVTWWNRPIRTIVAQKKTATAPCQDMVSRPPASGGSSTEPATHTGYSRHARTIPESASRSRAYSCSSACTESMIQPTCA